MQSLSPCPRYYREACARPLGYTTVMRGIPRLPRYYRNPHLCHSLVVCVVQIEGAFERREAVSSRIRVCRVI